MRYLSQSPVALVQGIREWFDSPVGLSGRIGNGDRILAAQTWGADLAHMGYGFIATQEATANSRHKQAIVGGGADRIVYSNFFTGRHRNYLRPSLVAAGLNTDTCRRPTPHA